MQRSIKEQNAKWSRLKPAKLKDKHLLREHLNYLACLPGINDPAKWQNIVRSTLKEVTDWPAYALVKNAASFAQWRSLVEENLQTGHIADSRFWKLIERVIGNTTSRQSMCLDLDAMLKDINNETMVKRMASDRHKELLTRYGGKWSFSKGTGGILV
jgi:hypothetical protein